MAVIALSFRYVGSSDCSSTKTLLCYYLLHYQHEYVGRVDR